METKVIEMSALGRALYPGMLYDCRADTFIPGVTLWDKNALCGNLDVQNQTKTYVKLAASDNIGDKASLLNVSASLKASFLSGLVEVGGSAKYLRDSKSSARQCRVTMQYSQTTKFEQLTMKELGTITYPQVFEQKTATHVVTAVLYGASAFMVFDYTASETESKQAIEGNLQAVVKKIPTISIEGQASLTMTQDEKYLADNMTVTFYGDYELDENPTTYKDALRTCKKLPTLLKNKGVPVTVWLYPLTLLDNRAAKVVREITLSLVCKTETLLEELGEVERRCFDLVKNKTTFDFPDIRNRLLQLQESFMQYKIAFQRALVSVLPSIRSGSIENKVLGDLLNNHYLSPFTAVNMNKWLDNITTEISILSTYTSGLKDLPVVKSSGSLNSFLFDPNLDVVVCLSFTSLKADDTYLAALKTFLSSDAMTDMTIKIEKSFSFQETQPWFTSLDISERMRQNLSLFTSFSKTNKTESRMKFIIASIPDSSNPGTSILIYQNGLLKNPKFQPVSKPPAPTVETIDENAIIKLSKSPTGETVQFRVEYRSTPPTDSPTDADAWKVIKTTDAQGTFTLSGLTSAQQYWVRYRALSSVGMGEPSDSVTFPFQGKVDYTMAPWDASMSGLYYKLRTKIMTNLGFSRWSSSTVKSELTNIINSPIIPYTDKVPGGLKPGMALYFQGVVLDTGVSFEINLLSGPKETGDYVFHMFFHIAEGYLNYNDRKSGNWESSVRVSGCPLNKGSAFDVFFAVKNEGYEVYINGQKSVLFNHRIPVDKVSLLHIYGDVTMNVIGTVQSFNTSTFGSELISGTLRTKASNIQNDVPRPVYNPNKPYVNKIPVTMRPGVALFFQGVVPSDFQGFSINLQSDQNLNDFIFHFNPRTNSVAMNSCKNGLWETEVCLQGGPFVKGGAFDLFIVARSDGYEIIVNGLPYTVFGHRTPVEKVNTLRIYNDVFINMFAVVEAGDLKMKATLPANF